MVWTLTSLALIQKLSEKVRHLSGHILVLEIRIFSLESVIMIIRIQLKINFSN